jgi:two-component system sensor histidine kinase UhpB
MKFMKTTRTGLLPRRYHRAVVLPRRAAVTLRLKINLIVGALTVFFVGAVIGLEWRGMRESVHEEVVAANRVAAQLLNRTAFAYAAQGTPAMRAFLEGVGRVRSNEITLYDAQGGVLYRSPPSTYKAGRDAPDWFERLLSPALSVHSIAFPDGKLVVESNASRAILDAWEDLRWLAAASLALLLVVNALVFWLVGRAARPFSRIVDALGALEGGRFDVALPPLPGREAGAIAAAFNRMVGQLQHHIETERRAVLAERRLSDSRELARWLDQHVEQERRLIARELHDELGQSVTAMRSMALSVAQRVGHADAESERAARLIADECSHLYDAMHGIIPRLTPLVLDSFGLADALGDLVERTRRSQPAVEVSMRVDVGGARLPAEVALALYRAAQEGITNAIRHGEASHIGLDVAAEGDRVRLCLDDDGRGLPPEGVSRAGHYGLRWLAERVEGLGGTLEVRPATPAGARLQVTVPLASTT